MKNAKSKRADAERAAIWYAHEVCKCVITRKAIRTQWQAVDFFGSDVVGKRADGSHVYIQVTAGQYSALSARRRKLEKIPWHITDTVILLQLRQAENPANARRKLWFFRVNELVPALNRHTGFYDGIRSWRTLKEACPVPPGWFKKYSENETP